jgi:hypothetical protein
VEGSTAAAYELIVLSLRHLTRYISKGVSTTLSVKRVLLVTGTIVRLAITEVEVILINTVGLAGVYLLRQVLKLYRDVTDNLATATYTVIITASRSRVASITAASTATTSAGVIITVRA